MKPLAILALFLCGCATRQGSETAAVERAIARYIVANKATGKSVVKIERHTDNALESNDGAKIIVSKNDGKGAVILQWIKENLK